MFERELEEYKNQPKWKGKIFMKDEETCFKDGAEFGYNKAKEELKKENAELKEKVSYLKDKECEIETSKAIMEMRNIIAKLKKENAELKEKVSYLKDNLRVARKDRENLQLKIGKGLKEYIKDCPYSALKLYANGYYVEQLNKAKEIILMLLSMIVTM